MSPQSKFQRQARLRWVPLKDIHVSPVAQRDFRQARIDSLVAEFDPEQLGFPTVNFRDSQWMMIDGQHRWRAYMAWLGDGNWEDQQIQCQAYEGLTEAEEAEVFLQLNNTLRVTPYDTFMISVTAGRERELDINRIVQANGMRVARTKSHDPEHPTVGAVAALTKIYDRSGSEVLARTLRIVFGAYGQKGLEAQVLDAFGLVVARYGSTLNDQGMATKLQNKLGLDPLYTAAGEIRDRRGGTWANCLAAAAVAIHNRKTSRTKEKLSDWWKQEGEKA